MPYYYLEEWKFRRTLDRQRKEESGKRFKCAIKKACLNTWRGINIFGDGSKVSKGSQKANVKKQIRNDSNKY